MKEKKNGSSHAGVVRKSAASDHWAMRPLRRLLIKTSSVEIFFSAIHTVLNLMELYLS